MTDTYTAHPGHHHAPALPFSESEWHEFQASDILAGKVIIALLGGIFLVGLILYTTVTIIVSANPMV